jgi:hypothetical protein
MTDLTAEDYARLAEAIGMRRDFRTLSGGRDIWCDPVDPKLGGINIPAYLAEPNQMARIMALRNLPGHGWLIERTDDPDDVEWGVSRQENNDDGGDWYYPTGAHSIGEAVRDCAAECLRP